jgi:hypothetical protein
MTRNPTALWWIALGVAWVGCTPADKDDGESADDGTTTEEVEDSDGGDGDDGSDGSGDGGSGDDGSGDDGSTDLDSLNGDVPDDPPPLPEFSATNSDGAARSREDLLGHPTVMWFYPAAATAG